mmetsp:Transcript_4133/g.13036  ORF Transcript_4133/g.13036 Transcript_4133/m.13036 type:complete len:388 (-) Transcript_4133:2071-3234(-)
MPGPGTGGGLTGYHPMSGQDETPVEGSEGCCSAHRPRSRVVGVELAQRAVPGGALQVERPHHAAHQVAVPHLERGLAVPLGVLEETVPGGAGRHQAAQHLPPREDQLPEQLRVVHARGVRDVHRAARHRPRGRVEVRALVDAVEHVPVHIADLAHEHGVVRAVGEVGRHGGGVAGVEVIAGPRHRGVRVRVEVVRGVAHAVDHVVAREVLRHGGLQRLVVRGRHRGGPPLALAHGPEAALPVHLDAVHARGRQVLMQLPVEAPDVLRGHKADAAEGGGVPREGRFHLRDGRVGEGGLEAGAVGGPALGGKRVYPTPVPDDGVPAVDEVQVPLALDAADKIAKLVLALGRLEVLQHLLPRRPPGHHLQVGARRREPLGEVQGVVVEVQ